MKNLIILVIFFLVSCAGTFTHAPIFVDGTYLQKCDYMKYSVCCNYMDVVSGCSLRRCNSMWQMEWKDVWDHCPGDTSEDRGFNEADIRL